MNPFHQQNQQRKSPTVKFNYHSPTHLNSLLQSPSFAQFQNNLKQPNSFGKPLQSLFQTKDCPAEEDLDTTFDDSEPEVQQPKPVKRVVAQSAFLPSFQKVQPPEFFPKNPSKFESLTFNQNSMKRSCMPGSFEHSFPSKANNGRIGKENHQSIKNSLIENTNANKSFNFNKNVSVNKPRRFFKHLSTAKIQDFQVGQMLGKGSVGKVYHARHILTNTRYALKKVVKTEVAEVQQFCLGVKCQLFFKSPHLAQIYAVFHDSAHIYLLMELCVDGSLSIHKKTMKTDYERNRVILSLAQGLEVMHQHHVRHGDLKLQNILISFGFPKITDFDCVFRGSSPFFRLERNKDQLWGSPAYFSPAMIEHSTFSLEDDIWALGVIMYEIYCKSHPFELTACGDLNKIVERDILPFPPELRQSIKTILTHLLSKDADNRPTLSKLIQCCEWFNEEYLRKH